MISACNARDCYGSLLKNKRGEVSAPGNELNRGGRDKGWWRWHGSHEWKLLKFVWCLINLHLKGKSKIHISSVVWGRVEGAWQGEISRNWMAEAVTCIRGSRKESRYCSLCVGWTQQHLHTIKNYVDKAKLKKTLQISNRTQQNEVNGQQDGRWNSK